MRHRPYEYSDFTYKIYTDASDTGMRMVFTGPDRQHPKKIRFSRRYEITDKLRNAPKAPELPLHMSQSPPSSILAAFSSSLPEELIAHPDCPSRFWLGSTLREPYASYNGLRIFLTRFMGVKFQAPPKGAHIEIFCDNFGWILAVRQRKSRIPAVQDYVQKILRLQQDIQHLTFVFTWTRRSDLYLRMADTLSRTTNCTLTKFSEDLLISKARELWFTPFTGIVYPWSMQNTFRVMTLDRHQIPPSQLAVIFLHPFLPA